MPTTAVPALRHVRDDGPYNATTFTEQNQAIVGKSARLRGFGLVSFTPNVSITLEPGAFISVGLALNPSEPTRISGIIAETTANAVLSAVGYTDDFYIFAVASSTSESSNPIFTVAASPAVPGTQSAPIARYIAGQFILEDAIGNDGLEQQVLKARTDSGADQFLLIPEVGPTPRAVTITGATAPDGSQFAGVTGFTGSPVFTVSSDNYIFFRTDINTIENDPLAFPGTSTTIPLWIMTLDGSGNVTNIVDSRPWFGGGGGGGGGGVTLEGLTFVPIEPTDSLVTSGSLVIDSAPVFTDLQIDTLGTAGITRPANATHALVTVYLDGSWSFTGGGNNSTTTDAYIGPYTATPGSLVAPRYSIATTAGNASAAEPANDSDHGTRVVELAPVADPFDFTIRLNTLGTIAVTGKTTVGYFVYLEGFFIEDAGTAPVIPTAEGFSAFKSTAQNIPSGTYIGGGSQVTSWDAPVFNNGSGFTAATGVFLVPADGIYLATASVGWDGFALGAARQLGIFIWVSGSIASKFIKVEPAGGANDPTLAVNTMLVLTAGDTVSLHAGQDTDPGSGPGLPAVGGPTAGAPPTGPVHSTFFHMIKVSA